MATLMIERIEEKTYTADEFMALPIDHADHGRNLGKIASRSCFLLRSNPDSVRIPNMSFLSNEMLEGKDTSSYIDGPPTIAVEIISNNDFYSEVDEKAHQFLEAGTKAVWVVNPRRKTITVLSPNNESKTYSSGQSVPGGDILPGFNLPVVEIFDT